MRRSKGIKIIVICVLLIVHSIRCETDEDFGTEEPEEDIYESYMRCQETQRCPMAYNEYDPDTTIETYFYSRFRGGELDRPYIFCDFENPVVGTHGWRKANLSEDQYYQEDMDVLHFSSYDDELELYPELVVEEGTIIINTDIPLLTIEGDDNNNDKLYEGTFLQTPVANRTVAVFNFRNIEIGEDVVMNVSGKYPLTIISRNNFIFNGTVEVPPGNLSGFLGVNDTDYYNKWGRGANPTQFYFYTLNFSVEPNPEIQWINTTVYTGDILSGSFTIDIGSECHTVPISSNATVEEMEQAINDCSDYYGYVTVEREIRERGMNHWTITFNTAIGDIPQLTINSTELRGYEHNIYTGTYNDGNIINGSYSLIFTDKDDNDIIVDGLTPNMTAKEMENIIIENVPYIYNITIAKSCPDYYECKNGLCDEELGCYYGWGHSYYITIQTKYDIAVIDTPTDSVELFNPMNISVESDLYDSSNEYDEVNITIVPYHVSNKFGEYIPYNLTDIPFVYYYGSFGGSYGGRGGGIMESGPIYGDNDIRDFCGGSSGALGTVDYHNIFDVKVEDRAGGSGGGAIEFSAVNDLYLFETAKITVNGENGKEMKGRGSGGGSGGAIVLSAGGIVENRGILQANGGDGGKGNTPQYDGGGGGGGRITVYAQSYYNHRPDLTVAKGGKSPSGLYNGEDGVVYKNVKYNMNITIDVTGTMGTNHSIMVQGAEEMLIDGPNKYTSYIISGPQHSLLNETDDNNIEDGPKPTRVSFYMRIKLISNQTNWGGFFCLHSNEVVDDETNNNNNNNNNNNKRSNSTNSTSSSSSSDSLLPKYLMMIGTAYVDGTFRYGANNKRTPANTVSATAPPDLSKLLLDHVEEMKWYRFDYLIDWENHVFEIMIDGITRAWDVFYGDYTTTVGLYNLYPITVWYDEIFVGGDHLTGFHNPRIFNDKEFPYDPVINTTTFTFTAWDLEDIGNETSYHEETEHHSHLYRRQKYHSCSDECSSTCNNSMIWFDGPPHMKYLSDIKDRDDQPFAQSTFSMASVIYVPDNQTKVETYLERYVTAITNSSTNSPNPNSQGKVGRYYWYSSQYETPLIYQDPDGIEYEYALPFYNKTLNKTEMTFVEQNVSMTIVCSSTDDFVNWRYEGIMLYSVNVSDDEGGRNGSLGFDKPKVLYNEKNDNYVMWFLVDDAEHSYGANGIAISDRPNGPFIFQRTFLPDGNETHDSTVIKRSDGIAFLVRTYYQTFTYWLPAPVMQPMWESVKLPPRPDEIKGNDGDDSTTYDDKYANDKGFQCPGYFTTCGIDENCRDPDVNYALNYHRAFYTPEYDNQHDIYIQRWRLEDKRWNITYYRRETTTEMNDRVKNTLEWLKNNTDKDFEDYPNQPYIYENGIWYEIADVEYRGSIRYIYNYNNKFEEEEEDKVNLYNVSVVDRFDGLMNLKEAESLGSVIFFKYDNSSNKTLSLEKQSQELKEELYASCCNSEYSTCCSLFEEATPTLEIVIRLVHSLMINTTDEKNHQLYLDFYDLSKEKPPVTNYLHVWDMKRVIYGQGDPYGSISRNVSPDPYGSISRNVSPDPYDGTLISRFLDPNRTENSCWHPSSVPAVKAQDWKDNYYDNNIADNPIHPTVPDKLIAPEHIVFERRTKYIAISMLNDDYTDTLGVAYILEGETLDDEPLVDLIEQFDPFNFSTLIFNKSDTQQRHFHGDVKPPFNFTTAEDWETRYWQFYNTTGDRRNDTVNFRDQITEGHT